MNKTVEQTAWANFLCATIIAGRGHITVPDAVHVADQALEAMKTRFDPKPKLAEVVPSTHTVNGVSLLPPDTKPKSK